MRAADSSDFGTWLKKFWSSQIAYGSRNVV